MDVAIIKHTHDFAQLNRELTEQAHIYIFLDAANVLAVYQQIKKVKWQVHSLLYWRAGQQLILMARKGKAYPIKNCGDKMVLLQSDFTQLIERLIENSLNKGQIYNDFV